MFMKTGHNVVILYLLTLIVKETEMDINIFKQTLGEERFEALQDITAFIDLYYNMDILYNEKNELKFARSKKTLVTFYIEQNKLTVLLIFGKKEREIFDAVRSDFSEYINGYYESSKTYHDGKWMFIDLAEGNYVGDIMRMICIKKKPDPKAITMCGYKCGLCGAYAKNIKKNDRREELSDVWHKYYGFRSPPQDIYCDGYRSKKKDAILIDDKCPVRLCAADRNLIGCAECGKYPCETFALRKGMSAGDAKAALKDEYSDEEYETYLKAYDNKARLEAYKKLKDKYDIMLS